jgi:hypothetical protein
VHAELSRTLLCYRTRTKELLWLLPRAARQTKIMLHAHSIDYFTVLYVEKTFMIRSTRAGRFSITEACYSVMACCSVFDQLSACVETHTSVQVHRRAHAQMSFVRYTVGQTARIYDCQAACACKRLRTRTLPTKSCLLWNKGMECHQRAH